MPNPNIASLTYNQLTKVGTAYINASAMARALALDQAEMTRVLHGKRPIRIDRAEYIARRHGMTLQQFADACNLNINRFRKKLEPHKGNADWGNQYGKYRKPIRNGLLQKRYSIVTEKSIPNPPPEYNPVTL